MTNDIVQPALTGEVLEDRAQLTLAELCQACQISVEQVIEIVDEGIIEPSGDDPNNWYFQYICVKRIRFVLHIEQDLGVNIAGAALALDLLEQLEELRTRLRRFDDK